MKRYSGECFVRLFIGFMILLFWLLPAGQAGLVGEARAEGSQASLGEAEQDFRYKVHLPMVSDGSRTTLPILLGVYPAGYLGNQSVIDSQLLGLNQWASPGAKLTIGGTFMSFEFPNPSYDVPLQLENLWKNGMVGFVNLNSEKSSRQIAQGELDGKIRDWARGYKAWASKGGGRFAYLAPLPEMNGEWVVWGMDPANFKLAFARIQQLFEEEGVSRSSVQWVFAPNGWSRPGTPGFESYYPGGSLVDVIGFSSYNFGYHPYTPTPDWQNPDEVFGPYLARMRQMDSSKPIFITQTGTTAYYLDGQNNQKKNEWLREAYHYLSSYPGVRGVIYFNLVSWENVDWPFYVPNDASRQYQGYREGIINYPFIYISPGELSPGLLLPN
jgi:hypothetical protein